jgi:predicted molibdopterin-dependent oxidoreductase YjgC
MTTGTHADSAKAPGRSDLDYRITDHPLLRYPPTRQVAFTFEGREVSGLEGEPIAAALLAAGVRAFMHSANLSRARGLFCAIGNCSSCLMVVDGRPNVRVCVEKLRAGMDVRLQTGKGQLGEATS